MESQKKSLNNTKIFIDSADPEVIKSADLMLKAAGYAGVEGVTTNPSLIAKRLTNFQFPIRQLADKSAFDFIKDKQINSNIQNLNKIKTEFYKKTVIEISQIIKGPISIQVICDTQTPVEDLLTQARERINWIPNGVIKFPVTRNGLEAASRFCQEGPVNMTLVFTQEQAAAVFEATTDAKFPVYLSPFVGRLDDIGQNGMDLAANILKMYRKFSNHHIRVICASIRTLDHLLCAIYLKSPVASIPFSVLDAWSSEKFMIPDESYEYQLSDLTAIPFQNLELYPNWTQYNLEYDLTQTGVAKFKSDWDNINQI